MSARLVRGLGAAGWWPRTDADRARSRREPGIPARERPQGRGRAPVLPLMGRMVRRAGGHGQPRLPGMAACSQLSQRRGASATVLGNLRDRRDDLRQKPQPDMVCHATGGFYRRSVRHPRHEEGQRTDHANIARYQLVAVDGSEPINPEPERRLETDGASVP